MARNPVAKERHRLEREELQRNAWLGHLFRAVLQRYPIVTFRTGDDYSVSGIDPRGKSVSLTESDLRDLLLRTSGIVWEKQCHGPCGRTLPIEHFGHDRNKPDGRLLRCKRCEAERVRAYKGKKRP